MPRRSRRRRGARGSYAANALQMRSGEFITTTRGICLLSTTNFSGTGNYGLNPTALGCAHLNSLADCFQFFRFTTIVIDLEPVSVAVAFGYGPLNESTNVSSAAEVLTSQNSVYHTGLSTVSKRLVLTKKDLLRDTAFKWFRTVTGDAAANASEWFQGMFLVYVASGALTAAVMYYELELAGPISPGISLELKEDKKRDETESTDDRSVIVIPPEPTANRARPLVVRRVAK